VDTVQRLLDRYADPSGLAVIVVTNQNQEGLLTRELESVLAARHVDVPVITPSDAKGEEYLAGVVVDDLNHPIRRSAEVEEVTIGRYKSMSGLYVAVSRFRDRLVIITTSTDSPIYVPD
jgi:hypothetical protein